MRKILVVLFIVAACLVARSETWVMTITSSTRCIPAQTISTNLVTTWTNGISVSAGGYYANTSGKAYMALSAGTSTNEPAHRSGIDSGADGIEWIFCSSSFGSKGVVACVMTGNEVHYNRSGAATTNCPWTVKNIFDPARGDWRFIPADGGTSTVSFLEL
jgi:hypothetical protein